MEFLLDTIDLDAIKRYSKVIPLAGVTSNPTIVKKTAPKDLYAHLREVRSIIGKDASLHCQVVGQTAPEMLEDAHTILKEVDDQVFIKVPVNEEGLKAIKQLKAEGVNVTATAIYTKFQAYLAMTAGADYLAPYYNRMVNMNIDADAAIADIAEEIKRANSKTKILAASFHTVQQVNSAFENGAQAATMGADVLATALGVPMISDAVAGFTNDFESVYGQGATMTSVAK